MHKLRADTYDERRQPGQGSEELTAFLELYKPPFRRPEDFDGGSPYAIRELLWAFTLDRMPG